MLNKHFIITGSSKIVSSDILFLSVSSFATTYCNYEFIDNILLTHIVQANTS